MIGLGGLLAVACPVLAEGTAASPGLRMAYAGWVDALEADGGQSSAWELPFATPRSAGISEADLQTILSLRRLARNDDLPALETLSGQVEARGGDLPVPLRFWLAFAQYRLGSAESCRAYLVTLVETPDGWTALENGQIAWLVTTLADELFLAGRRAEAAALYSVLAGSSVPQLELWGNFQLAGLDFLGRNFAAARRRYEQVCQADEPGIWREQACGMARIARQLSELEQQEGKSHGPVAAASP